jgi:serine/threonine protein kinase
LVAEQERSVLELVRTIQHPNIVEFLGSYTYQDNLNLLFPLAETDLRTFFRSECRISWDAVYYGIYGLADALQSIHNLTFVSDGVESRRIGYHHDLRPANILLRGSDFLIADFGLAKLKKEDETSKSPLRGGQEDYLAPEAFNEIESENGNVGRALDVWAFGCIVAEFATYIHGSDVEAFKRARKSSHWHGKFQRTDSAFHLDGKLRPAVNDWLVQLRSYPPLLLEDELIRLSRQMLDPIWRTRTRIGPVVGQLGTLALNRKVDSIVYNFLLLNPRPHRPNNPSEVYMTLESHRFLAWFECYKSIENGIKRTKLIQILKLAENLISCLEAYLLHPRKSLDQANVADTAANFHAIWDVVDELGAELPKRLQQEMNQLWTKRVMDIDDTFLKNINPQVLPNRYRVVGIKGTMKYLSGAISQSTRLGNTRMLVDSGTFDKDGSSFEFPDRIMGYYLDTRAILEWLPYDHRWEGARGDAMLNRVEALARLLNIEETPRAGVLAERVLNCLGYFHEKSMKRFGLIYVAPSPQPDQAATKCFSLNSIIQADSVPAPFLGDVFRMAFGIVKTVTALHEIGWLHKGISSENILIFSPTRTDTYRHVALAMLSGFSDSRPESEREMSLGPNQVSAYYHHPKYIASQAKFEKKYDFFSVGIVLLEIGLWYTMYQFSIDKEIRYPDSESWAEQNRNTLLEKYVPQLGGRMGKWYQDAVAFCLDVDICLGSLEGNNTEGSSTAQEAFQENVVARLARCSA